jgi:hypothetical protein
LALELVDSVLVKSVEGFGEILVVGLLGILEVEGVEGILVVGLCVRS